MPPSIEPQLITADIVENNGALLGLKSKSANCDCYDNYVRSIQLDIKKLAQNPAFKAQVRERLHVSSVTTVQIDITEEDLKIRSPGGEEWISIYSDLTESEERETIGDEMAQIIEKTHAAYARYRAHHRTHSPSTPSLYPSPLNARISSLRSPVSKSELQGRIDALEDTVERLHRHIGRLSSSRECSPRDTLGHEDLLGHKTLKAAQIARDLRKAEETIQHLQEKLEHSGREYKERLRKISEGLSTAREQASQAQKVLEKAQASHSEEAQSLRGKRNDARDQVQELEAKLRELNESYGSEVEGLSGQIRSLKRENRELRDLLAKQEHHLEKAERRNGKERSHLSREVEREREKVTNAERRFQESSQAHALEMERLTGPLEEVSRTREQLRVKIGHTEKERDAARAETVSAHQDLALERLLHAETSRLAGEEISRLEELLRTATEDYQSHLKRITAEHASAQERTHELEDEMQHLSEALKETRKKLDSTTEERDTTRQDLGLEPLFNLETAGRAHKEITWLEALLKTTSQHYQEAQSCTQALEKELTEVNLSYQAQVKDLSTRLDQANRESLRLGEELASAKKEALTLTHRLSTATERYYSEIERLMTQYEHEQEKLQKELLRLNETYQSELRSVHQDLGLERLLHAETARLAGLEIKTLTERLEDEATSYQGQILELGSEVERTQLERRAEKRRLLETHKRQLSTIALELEQTQTRAKQAEQEAEKLQALLDKQKRILDEAKRIAKQVVLPHETISIAEDLMGSGVHPSAIDPTLTGVGVESYQVAGDNYFTLPRQLQTLIDRNNELQEALAAAEERHAKLYRSGERQSEEQQRQFSSRLEEIRSEAERVQQLAIAEAERVKALAKRDHDQFVKRNLELKAEVEKLKASVQAYEESDSRQDAQIERLEGQNRDKQEQVDTAQSKITELEAALAEDNSTILGKIDQINDLERANCQLGSAIGDLRDKLHQEVEYRQSVEARNEKLAQKLKAAKLRIEVLAEALSSKGQQHQKELDTLQEKLDKALLENEKLHRDIAALEAENQELRELLERTRSIADELGAEFDPYDIDKNIRAMDLRAFQVVQERDLTRESLEKLRAEMRQAAEEARSTQAFLANRATSIEEESERFKTQLAQMLGASVSPGIDLTRN